MSRPHFLDAVLQGRFAWGLQSERTGKWLATTGALAGTSAARRRGLIGRHRLADGHALVIAPSQGIHTFGMRFPIDVVGVARDGTVLTIRRQVAPRRIVLSLRAFAVVELPAGATDRIRLEHGDRLLASQVPFEPT